jgi:fimbrial isopeptide formation D2 family protein/LPXTG-motif cell wall-anchored protein
MKFLKKAFTLSLAVLLAGGMGITAIRAEGDGAGTPAEPAKGDSEPVVSNTKVDVTVNGNTHSDFVYYQIFAATGQVNEEDDQPLTGISWGKDVGPADVAEIIKAVNGILELTGSAEVPANASAQDVAKALSTMNSEEMIDDQISHSPKAIHLARALYAIMKDHTGNPLQVGSNKVDIGYYLIVDKSTLSSTSNDALNAALLQLTRDVTVRTKTDAPAQVEKHIVVGDKTVDADTAGIGDTVNFQITSKVPDLTYFTTYLFAIADNMSDGLKLVKPETGSPFKITVGSATLTYGTDYTVEYGKSDEDDFIITFTSMKKRFDDSTLANFTAGANISIEYSATVVDDASFGNPGNPNDVKLYYQNDPNWYGGGTNPDGSPYTDPDGNPITPQNPATPLGPNNPDNPDLPIEPDPEHPIYPTDPSGNPTLPNYVGDTPWDRVITYVAEVVIEKVDDQGKPLKDASFNLSGEALKTLLADGKYYAKVAADTGDYYKLKDGSYTQTAPTTVGEGANASLYETTTKDYKLVEYKGVAKNSENASYDATTGEDGVVIFAGVNAGEYTLKETKAPQGFNLIEGDAKLVIQCHVPTSVSYDDPSTQKATWNYTVSGGVNSTGTSNDGQVVIKVENRKGTALPETGGMGTTLFYVIGGVLAIGAGVLLVAKKRLA